MLQASSFKLQVWLGHLMPFNSLGVTKTTHPLLICEALGFSPQLLLDDVINTDNNAVQNEVNGMEEFLQKWANEKLAKTQPF